MLSVDDITKRLQAIEGKGWICIAVGAVIGALVVPGHRLIGAVIGGAGAVALAVTSGPCCAACAGANIQPATGVTPGASTGVLTPGASNGNTGIVPPTGGGIASPPPPRDSPGGPAPRGDVDYAPLPDVSSFWGSLPCSRGCA